MKILRMEFHNIEGLQIENFLKGFKEYAAEQYDVKSFIFPEPLLSVNTQQQKSFLEMKIAEDLIYSSQGLMFQDIHYVTNSIIKNSPSDKDIKEISIKAFPNSEISPFDFYLSEDTGKERVEITATIPYMSVLKSQASLFKGLFDRIEHPKSSMGLPETFQEDHHIGWHSYKGRGTDLIRGHKIFKNAKFDNEMEERIQFLYQRTKGAMLYSGCFENSHDLSLINNSPLASPLFPNPLFKIKCYEKYGKDTFYFEFSPRWAKEEENRALKAG